MNILIADDEAGIVELIREVLLRHGHKIDAALDGKEALELLAKGSYELAFLDVTMPEVTGLEIVEFIKKKGIETRTVIITGYTHIEDEFAKTFGADEYLSKPFGIEQIEAIVRKYDKA